MKINKLSILFLVEKTKINSQGLCPIKCRITYQGNRKPFATGLFINPKHWHSKLQKAKPPNDENDFINNELSLIKNKINQAFLFLQVQENEFTVEDIYAQYVGKPIARQIGIVFYYDEFLEKYKKLIGIEIKQATWNKFSYILSDLKDFIQWKYKQKDFHLKNIDMAFINELEYYLKTEKGQKQITINKVLQRFKKIVKLAVESKIIDKYPFAEHRIKSVKNQIIYLSVEELATLENHQFSQPRLQQIADMFTFCCYTGLAYNEMNQLQSKHIIEGFDGNQWIQMQREKTQKLISIPLLPKALLIIEKYQKEDEVYILPRISNQKFNSYMKEIADVVGIEKNLTHHIGRKTFATTVLLYNDVPMEIVSELLGHSKITITQEHYGKVVQKKVSEHIVKLSEKLEKK